MSAYLGLIALFLLTAATGYFVAQEFAFVAADRALLRDQAAAGDQAAERALKVTSRLSFMLSGAQLGITVTALIVGFLAEPAIASLIRPFLGDLPLGVSAAVGVLVATVVQMVLGELMPKNLGISRPEQVAKSLARSTLIYLTVAGPVIRLFDTAAIRLLRAVGVEPVEEVEQGATPGELSRIIAESTAAGELPPRLSELLERALEFGDRDAGEAMVPRPRVVTLRADRPIADLLQSMRESGHSRFPVIGAEGDVVGVTGVRELLSAELAAELSVAGAEFGGSRISQITRPAVLVPDSLPLPVVLERMRQGKDDLVCVIDEYGGLAGVISIEDLAEELVGELVDENDPEPLGAVQQPDGVWDVPATLRLDEIERATGLALPESDDYDTVAGLVLARLGRMPEPGDTVTVELTPEHDPFDEDVLDQEAVLTVLSLSRRVPEWVRLEPVRVEVTQ